ncbi:MAG: hypothetical protein Q9207_000711 [Kuettlingeria erythrocarpa]
MPPAAGTIRDSKPCAIATAQLLRRVVGAFRVSHVAQLIERVQQVGRLLVAAQPRELAIGNIVRRILGVIRDEAEENRNDQGVPCSDAGGRGRPDTSDLDRSEGIGNLSTDGPTEHRPQPTSQPSYVAGTNTPITTTSLFSLLSHPSSRLASPSETPGIDPRLRQTSGSIHAKSTLQDAQDLRAEVIEGIQEIVDELNQADDQMAGYAQDYIHSNETILTHTPSTTLQKFLVKAAAKRKFTVIYAETSSDYHHPHQASSASMIRSTSESDVEAGSDQFKKALTAASVTVVVVPFSAIFALMSRVDKVLLGTHAVLADGGLVAAAGAKAITKAAKVHRTPVVVLSAIYNLSPVYPFDTHALIEYGGPSQINAYGDGAVIGKMYLENPLFDFVQPDLVDLYITNLFVLPASSSKL